MDNETTAQQAVPVFTISRAFDAPRSLVFQAWSEPERLAKWWGPKGMTIRVAAFDFRPGGLFHYAMGMPNGQEMWGKFVYGEIDKPTGFVFTNSFSDADAGTTRAPFNPDWPLEVRNLLTLTEDGGKTTVTLKGSPINATPAECAAFAGFFASMEQGFGGTMDALAEYLADYLAEYLASSQIGASE